MVNLGVVVDDRKADHDPDQDQRASTNTESKPATAFSQIRP